MELKSGNDKSIEHLKSSKKVTDDELFSQQGVVKETILRLEEEMPFQKQRHLSSQETSKEKLKTMETKLSVREKEWIISRQMK